MRSGGIGGGLPGPAEEFAADPDPEPEPVIERPMAPIPTVSLVEIGKLQAECEELRQRRDELELTIGHMQERLEALEALHTGLEGTQAQHWNGVLALDRSVRMLDARLTAVAQQVVRNSRKDALDAAIRAKGPADTASHNTRNAEIYEAWLTRPMPAPSAQPEEDQEQELSNGPRITSH